MTTYLTLDTDVLDLSQLSDAERAFFDRCCAAYRAGTAYETFRALVDGPDNPLMRPNRGRITAAVWQHPLYRAVRDLEDRLGIAQGEVGPAPGDDLERDPLADEWLPAVEAAAQKGVTLAGLHKAIERGDVVAAPLRPGGVRLKVSRNSLDHWTPNRVRQAARRKQPAAVR
jgi:hypothetical protein